jgi:saccharopepsin
MARFINTVLFSIAFLLLAGCGGNKAEKSTLSVPLLKGIAKDNGATPWYAVWTIGESDAPDKMGQQLKMMMDTGTSNFWVASTQCKSAGCATHDRYDLNASTTWKPGAAYPAVFDQQLGPWGKFRFNYGIDSWSLDARTSLADIHFQMAVELIDGETNGTYNRNWDDLVCDGGMGFPLYANPELSSSLLLDELVRQGLAERKILAFRTDPALKRGTLLIGGWDPSLVDTEHFNRIRVNDVGRADNGWIVDLDGVKVGAEKISLPVTRGDAPNLQLDTGSSRFKGDPDYINMIVAAITLKGGSGTVVYDESKLDDYPDLTLTLNGVDYTLTARQYFQRFVAYDPVTNEGQVYWKLAFQPLEGLEGILLVGSVLLDTLYSVYLYPDADQNAEHMVYLGKYTYERP